MISRRAARTALAALMMIVLSVGGSQVRAAISDSPGSIVTCTTSGDDTVAPGLTSQIAGYTYVSIGKGATATCSGRLHGKDFTGSGYYFEHGPAFGSCQSGSGAGDYKITIWNASGKHVLSGEFFWYYLNGGTGEDFGRGFHVNFTMGATPDGGDCVDTPITKVLVVQTVVITSDAA